MKTRGVHSGSPGKAGVTLMLAGALFLGLVFLGAFAKLCIAAFDLLTGSVSWLFSSAARLLASLI